MQTLEDVKVINVDDVPYAVDACSEAVQNLVGYYNEWRAEEFDLKKRTLMVEAALRDLSREIITMIRKEKEEAEAAAEADVDVADAAPEAAPEGDTAAE